MAEAEAQQAQTEKLLKIADPDGWFRPDSKAAVEAKARAASEMLLARHRKAAEDAARRTAKIKEADAAPFVPEEDDDEEEKRGGQGGDTERRGGQLGADSVPGGEAAVGDTKPDLAGMSGAGVARQPTERSAEETGEGRGNDSSRQPSSSSAKGYLGGANTTQDQQKSKMKPGRASARGIGGLLARGDLSMPATSTVRVAGGNAKKATDLHSRAAASVADKLAVLSRLKNRGGAGSIEEEEGGGMMDWKPPEGQTGDGRTALNDQLGY